MRLFPHAMRLSPAGHHPTISLSRGISSREFIIIIVIIIIIIVIIIIIIINITIIIIIIIIIYS